MYCVSTFLLVILMGTIKRYILSLYLVCRRDENIYCFSFCEVDFFC